MTKKYFCWFVLLSLSVSVVLASTTSGGEADKDLRKLERDLKTGASQTLMEMIDLDAILNFALKDIDVNDSNIKQFVQHIKERKSELVNGIINRINPNGQTALIKVSSRDKKTHGLFRLDFGNGGFGYLEFQIVMKNGKAVVVNWYDYGSGQLYSQTIQQIVITAFSEPTFIRKLLGIKTDQEKIVDAIFSLIKLAQLGKYQQAVAEYDAMGPEHKKIRFFMVLMIQYAQRLPDEVLYDHVLNDLGKYHGEDPTLSFLLVDHYYNQRNYQKAIAMIDSFKKEIGVDDEALLVLKAQLLIESGSFDPAFNILEAVISRSAEFELAYSVAFGGYIQKEEYDSAVSVARKMEKQFGFEFTPEVFQDEPAYRGFTESTAYSRWLGEKQ